jgi:Arc/MetJ-type ribon-helix-helix transcriptional regulator
MNIPLDPETQRLFDERMRLGGYATPADVVRAGLALLAQQESSDDFDAGELEEFLAEGERSGPPLDGEEVLAELRALRTSSSSKAG